MSETLSERDLRVLMSLVETAGGDSRPQVCVVVLEGLPGGLSVTMSPSQRVICQPAVAC